MECLLLYTSRCPLLPPCLSSFMVERPKKQFPSREEWDRVEEVIKLFKIFMVSLASFLALNTTVNLYYHKVFMVQKTLIKAMQSWHDFVSSMACWMYSKFQKYWSKYSTTIVIDVILDLGVKFNLLISVLVSFTVQNHSRAGGFLGS